MLPAWRNRKPDDITRRDVKALLNRILERGAPIAANRTLALISKIFNYSVEEEVVEANPAYRLQRPAEERERERVLSEGEIRAVWATLNKEPFHTAAVFKLGLLLAQHHPSSKAEVVAAIYSSASLCCL